MRTQPQAKILEKIRKNLRRYPALRGPARTAYRKSQYFLSWAMGKARQDPMAVLWIDPAQVVNTIGLDERSLTGNQLWHLGKSEGGDWDLGGAEIKTYDGVYEILEGRIILDIPYEKIERYRQNILRIEKGEIVDSAATVGEYQVRWQKIESLAQDIDTSGYKSQAELGNNNPIDEIRVQIGRHGDFLFEEGLHRLAIAQLLGISRIPVLVTRRHANWAALRQEVLKIVLQRGFFHQPFAHTDLDALNGIYGSELAQTAVYGHDRWGFIHQNLPFNSGTVLDIGAYFGYFCHRLEAAGFECLAVEPDPENFRVLKSWRKIRQRHFEVSEQSIFTIEKRDFDLVLALNIFHHLVRTENDHAKLEKFLQQLDCRAMIFEPDDNAAQDAYRHYSDEEFIDFVLKNSNLRAAKWLGKAQEGRNIYLLTK